MKTNLALSGGGAGGLAHIPVLEAIDDLGLRPHAIAGVSAGALVGAAFASGLSGAAIRAHVDALSRERLKTLLRAWRPGRSWPGMGFDALQLVDALLPAEVPDRIEDLAIPLTIVATDIQERRPVYIAEGDLRSAIAASIAIPGLFQTVARDGRFLVDGGVTDNLGLVALPDGFTIAVDVATNPAQPVRRAPKGFAASFAAMETMMAAMLRTQVEARKPDVFIRARADVVRPLDVLRPEQLLASLDTVRAAARAEIEARLAGKAEVSLAARSR